MFRINGKLFVKDKKELVASLFEKGGTACGFYRVVKDGIKLMDLQKEPRVFIKTSDSYPFAVTMSKLESGKVYYMHSLTNLGEAFIGVAGMTYKEELESIKVAVEGLNK